MLLKFFRFSLMGLTVISALGASRSVLAQSNVAPQGLQQPAERFGGHTKQQRSRNGCPCGATAGTLVARAVRSSGRGSGDVGRLLVL